MKAVVTGATGHLGINLVSELLAQGHDVRALVRGSRRVGVFPDVDGFEQVICDLRDEDALSRTLRGADVVFHAAGKISIDGDRQGDVWETNVLGTARMVRAARRSAVGRFVHVSSIQAHDNRARPGERLDETFPLWESTTDCAAYGFSKAEAERVVESARQGGLDVVVVRPTGVLGPMDPGPSPLGKILRRIARGELLAVTTGGFDFVDVRDVVQAMIRASSRSEVAPAYLLGGRYLTLAELAQAAAEISHASPRPLEVPVAWATPFAPLVAWASRMLGNEPIYTTESLRTITGGRRIESGLARRDLDYHPRSLRSSLADLFDYFRMKDAQS